MDPRGASQVWASACYYLCTSGVIVQSLLAVIVTLCGGQAHKGWCEGDVGYRIGSEGLSWLLVALRMLALACLYGGFTAVLVSILVLEHRKGPRLTPPPSPAILCVIALSVLFFAVYLALFVSSLVREAQ